jgi:hypothetical protein
MVWPGAFVLFAGAILTFAISGHIGNVDVGTVGMIAMIFGALLLVAGLLRLNRGHRSPVVSYQDRMYRTSKGKIIAMIAAVVYIVSPIDLVPDFLLPIGIVDDATAFGWLLFAIGQEVTRKRRRAL